MTTPHAKYSMGQLINYSKQLAINLIERGGAEKYSGQYPPKGKMKTNFFKPK